MQPGGHAQVFHLQHRFSGLGGRLVHHEVHVAPNHHAGKLLARGVCDVHRADVFALAQHRAAIGYGHDFVQLVRYEQDALALGGQVAHDVHQLVDFLRREHGGGLVEDQNFVFAVQHFQNLRALLHAHGDVLDQRVRIDAQAVFIRKRQHAPARVLLLQEAEFAGLHAHDDVVQHTEAFHQFEVLVHHADAQRVGIVWILDLHLAAILFDHALFRLIQAEQHAHQRGFARAVFAQQRVDLALAQLQGDIVVGYDAGEALGDVQHLNGIAVFQFLTTSRNMKVNVHDLV